MKPGVQHDWNPVIGEWVQIRRRGEITCSGVVDAVTHDGAILWILGDGIFPRRMFERADGYEVWIGSQEERGTFPAVS